MVQNGVCQWGFTPHAERVRTQIGQHDFGKGSMRSWLSALTLGEWALTKPCNGGNASTSLIDASTTPNLELTQKGAVERELS